MNESKQKYSLKDIDRLAVNTIRIIAAEGVQKANSGHPGMPLGMADCAYVLWSRYLKFNPKDPNWVNRDRFVLSAGHGSMLLYTLLHLSGFDVTIDDLKSFRQWESRTPGHPEYGCLPGVETTTGPLGQGFANGVGMAIASKMTAARFNSENEKLFGNHFIYGIVSDGDLMEGLSHEAASIAGNLKLGNIIYLYDNNSITIEGKTEITFSEDIAKRFESYGWHTISIDGHNHCEIAQAIEEAQKETGKPSLIIAKTHIGFGCPNLQDTSEVHGSPLGVEELKLMKKNLDWHEDKEFYVPEEVKKLFSDRVDYLSKEFTDWQNRFNNWGKSNPKLLEEWAAFQEKRIPDNLEEELLKVAPTEPNATRTLSSKVIQKLAELIPNLIGGSADLAPSTSTWMKSYLPINASDFKGRNFHFGIREHAMGSILNGISLYGGFIPFGATFLVFSDYMRPPIRLAAFSNIHVIYVFTHDSIFVGEDGPTLQPVEQFAALRTIPNLKIIRPCDGFETAMAWAIAVRNQNSPVALILTRQKVDEVKRNKDFDPNQILKGGYIISKEKNEKIDLTIVASGSEVPVAIKAKKMLEDKLSVRVVSMPSIEIFRDQDSEYRNTVVPANVHVVTVEAGITMGWGDLFRQPILNIGINRYGASAPYKVLYEKFGLTPEQIAKQITEWFYSKK